MVLLVSPSQMNLTIKEVLRFGGLVDAQIVAGSGGIDNRVESISVLEVAESEIARWVLKNQMYITSFYSIAGNVEMQKEVIQALQQAKGCGLVLCHFERYVKHLDQEIIDLCDSLNFPLIIAKSEVSYVEILNPIIERLMNLKNDKSLVYSKKNRMKEREEVYIQNYYNDLIAWNFRNEEVALSAGLELGLDITAKSRLMALTVNSFQDKKIQPYAWNYLFSQITVRVKAENIRNIVGYKDKVIFILLQEDSSAEDRELDLTLGNSLIELCQQRSLGSASIGMSSKMRHFTEIPKAYSEALDAAVIGRNFMGENKVTRYSDLGFLTIIKEMKNQSNVLEIASNLLRPLRDYDNHNHTNLCETLDYLFRYNSDITLIAEKLYVHKNTVLYRKNKIIEILGKNPTEAPYNLNYLIAFALHKVE